MAFISILFIFIISDHGSIFCGFAGWKNSDGYIQCQARDWICGEWLKHNHTNTKRETNQSMQTLTGFLLDNCDTYIFFRLKWPTLEKHPLVPALEVVVEPKLNTELANKNFRSHSIQSPETRTGIEFDELQIPRQPSWMCQVHNSAPTPSVELALGGALV